jgi:hypothetical protein
MFLQNHGSVLLLVRKHHSRPYYLLYAALTAVLFAARSAEWAALAGLPACWRARARARRFAEALGRPCAAGLRSGVPPPARARRRRSLADGGPAQQRA